MNSDESLAAFLGALFVIAVALILISYDKGCRDTELKLLREQVKETRSITTQEEGD